MGAETGSTAEANLAETSAELTESTRRSLLDASRELEHITNWSALYSAVEALFQRGALARHIDPASHEATYYVPDSKGTLIGGTETGFVVAHMNENSYMMTRYDQAGHETNWVHMGKGGKYADSVVAERSTSYHPNGNPAHREFREG